MAKERRKKYVRFITEYHPLFKAGEIGYIVKGNQTVRPDLTGQFVVNQRGGKIQTLDGKKLGYAREGLDYERIEPTKAIQILYGSNKAQILEPEVEEKEYGKVIKYKVKKKNK